MDIESTIKEIVTDELTVIPFDNITNIDWEKFYSVIDKYKKGINSNLIIGNGSRYLKYKSISLTDCIEGLNLFKDTFCNYLSDEVNRYNNKEKVSDNFILPPNFSCICCRAPLCFKAVKKIKAIVPPISVPIMKDGT